MDSRANGHKSSDGVPEVSAEARDALYSLATDLLGGIGSQVTRIDPQFSDDLRHLLERLAVIGDGGPTRLAMPPAVLRRVITGIQEQLPADAEADGRSRRTRLVAQTCTGILAQLGVGQEENGR